LNQASGRDCSATRRQASILPRTIFACLLPYVNPPRSITWTHELSTKHSIGKAQKKQANPRLAFLGLLVSSLIFLPNLQCNVLCFR
jgi:hypothetical protein